MVNCNKGKPCGRACIPQVRTCRKDAAPGQAARAPRAADVAGQRKEPTCREGLTRKCGRACISVTRNCRIDGTQGVATGAAAAGAGNNPNIRRIDPALLRTATLARKKADQAYDKMGGATSLRQAMREMGGSTVDKRKASRTWATLEIKAHDAWVRAYGRDAPGHARYQQAVARLAFPDARTLSIASEYLTPDEQISGPGIQRAVI